MGLISFFSNVFFMCATPGPNNLILFKISSTYGYKKAFPYLIGVFCMGIVMLVSLELGLSKLLEIYKWIEIVIAIFGALFMFYLTYKIMFPKNKENKKEKKQREYFGFWYGVLVQSLNPKSWIAGISFVNLYMSLVDFTFIHFIILPLVLNIMGVIGGLLWIFFGGVLTKFLSNPKNETVFNYIMGGVLIYLGVSFVINTI